MPVTPAQRQLLDKIVSRHNYPPEVDDSGAVTFPTMPANNNVDAPDEWVWFGGDNRPRVLGSSRRRLIVEPISDEIRVFGIDKVTAYDLGAAVKDIPHFGLTRAVTGDVPDVHIVFGSSRGYFAGDEAGSLQHLRQFEPEREFSNLCEVMETEYECADWVNLNRLTWDSEYRLLAVVVGDRAADNLSLEFDNLHPYSLGCGFGFFLTMDHAFTNV